LAAVATGAAGAVVVFAGVVAPAAGAAFEPEAGVAVGIDAVGLVAGAGVDDGTDAGFTAGAAAGRAAAGAGVAGAAGAAAGVRAAYETGPGSVVLTGATLG
jgi:hypothetical protein